MRDLTFALPRALVSSRPAQWAALALLCLFAGDVSYQTFLVTMGPHFGQFVQHNLDTLAGHAPVREFQSRMLPSLEPLWFARITGVDYTLACYIFYRLSFNAISLAVGLLLCRPAVNGFGRAALCVLAFNACNLFLINAGYWLIGFDLQNQLCMVLLLGVFLSNLKPAWKATLLIGLAAIWQLTFEEVIYVPILYFFYLNIDDLTSGRFARVGLRPLNWGFGLLTVASLILTNLCRGWFHHGGGVDGGVRLLGQWIMAGENWQSFTDEVAVLRHPLRPLLHLYWAQGIGLYILLNVAAGAVAGSMRTLDNRGRAILALFVTMSLITLAMAHLAETNTLLPLLVTIFALRTAGETANSG